MKTPPSLRAEQPMRAAKLLEAPRAIRGERRKAPSGTYNIIICIAGFSKWSVAKKNPLTVL